MSQPSFDNGKEDYQYSKNYLEWSVFGLSLILVAGILIYLSYKTVTFQSSTAEIRVVHEMSPTETEPYRFHLLVKNVGGETAEDVLIEFALQDQDSVIEKAEINFQFIPQHSEREGWINFSSNPNAADSITTRVVSFRKP